MPDGGARPSTLGPLGLAQVVSALQILIPDGIDPAQPSPTRYLSTRSPHNARGHDWRRPSPLLGSGTARTAGTSCLRAHPAAGALF